MHQSYEQKNDECFIPSKWEEETEILKPRQAAEVDVSSIVQKILPSGNELHHKFRSTNLAPRTCFPELSMHLLPPQLNLPSSDTTQSTTGASSLPSFSIPFPKVPTTLGQEFAPPTYRCIYNKFSLYRQKLSKSKHDASRYKNITFLQDYNEKLFQELKPEPQTQAQPHSDQFSSNFECGNLGAVFERQIKGKISEKEYYLILENDVNSLGYTNWFFFRVKNVGTGKRNFHLVNMSKSSGLLKKEMKFSVFSKINNEKKNEKWVKGGQNSFIYNTNFTVPHKESSFYSCLYFEYTFENENDEVYFSQTQPYTYSRLVNFLSRLDKKYFVQPNRPVYSLSSNIIPIINFDKQNRSKKKSIVFLGRQHPAETVGSFTIEGVLEELISQSPESKFLRDNYQIVVVPMVNPDGVIHGNSRCSLSGLDLNRQWGDTTFKQFTPQTIKLKKYLLSLHQQSEIQYLIDMHGHSKKWNSFFFCCKFLDKIRNYFFPMLMSKVEKKFDFYSCTYGVGADKINTIRGQFHQLGIKQCYTLQTSYYGYVQDKQVKFFMESDLKKIGVSVIQALSLLINGEKSPRSYQNLFNKLNITRNSLRQEISKDIQSITKINKQLNDSSDLQSDSDPEGDVLDIESRMNLCQQLNEKGNYKKPLEIKSSKKPAIQQLKKNKKRYANVQRKTHENFQTTDLNEFIQNHNSEKKFPPQTIKISTPNHAATPSSNTPQTKFRHGSAKAVEMKKTKLEGGRPLSHHKTVKKYELKVFDEEKKNVSTSIIYKHPCYWMNGNPNSKKNIAHNRIKTQIMHQMEQNQSKGHIFKLKSQHQFKDEVKQENFNGTLLIKKVSDVNQLEKLENVQKTITSNDQNLRIQTHSEQQLQLQIKKSSVIKNLQEGLGKRKESLQKKFQDNKYKKFERFLAKKTITKKPIPQKQQKQQSSVFYYFPIL